jgi:hypothetical protein
VLSPPSLPLAWPSPLLPLFMPPLPSSVLLAPSLLMSLPLPPTSANQIPQIPASPFIFSQPQPGF